MNEHHADDDIPTLTHLIVPGDPNKRHAPAVYDPDRAARSQDHQKEAPQARQQRPSFRANIDAMIEEILQRHMAQAREEITAQVIAEVLSRVPRSKG